MPFKGGKTKGGRELQKWGLVQNMKSRRCLLLLYVMGCYEQRMKRKGGDYGRLKRQRFAPSWKNFMLPKVFSCQCILETRSLQSILTHSWLSSQSSSSHQTPPQHPFLVIWQVWCCLALQVATARSSYYNDFENIDCASVPWVSTSYNIKCSCTFTVPQHCKTTLLPPPITSEGLTLLPGCHPCSHLVFKSSFP